jgi:hypothetical protein
MDCLCLFWSYYTVKAREGERQLGAIYVHAYNNNPRACCCFFVMYLYLYTACCSFLLLGVCVLRAAPLMHPMHGVLAPSF